MSSSWDKEECHKQLKSLIIVEHKIIWKQNFKSLIKNDELACVNGWTKYKFYLIES